MPEVTPALVVVRLPVPRLRGGAAALSRLHRLGQALRDRRPLRVALARHPPPHLRGTLADSELLSRRVTLCRWGPLRQITAAAVSDELC